jgi:hypothetical protein
MAASSVKVRGYREFLRAAAKASKETRAVVRTEFGKIAEPVRADATSRMSVIDARSAAGFRVAVRQRGVAVEQRIKRTTGKRGDYGSLQMRRALMPALSANADKIEHGVEKAIDRIADRFEKGAA